MLRFNTLGVCGRLWVETIRYSSGSVIPVHEIMSWEEHCPPFSKGSYPRSMDINKRVALWSGNITHLEVDAIQNATNSSLSAGERGLNEAIHQAAGPMLQQECAKLNGCEIGETKITKAYNLPAKYILHTVGPKGENPGALTSCYETTLNLAVEHNLRTIALCLVSTGIEAYPRMPACHRTLKTVREWMMENDNWKKVDKIIFVPFLQQDTYIYQDVLPEYFPNEEQEENKFEPLRPKDNLMIYTLTVFTFPAILGLFLLWYVTDK